MHKRRTAERRTEQKKQEGRCGAEEGDGTARWQTNNGIVNLPHAGRVASRLGRTTDSVTSTSTDPLLLIHFHFDYFCLYLLGCEYGTPFVFSSGKIGPMAEDGQS
jgi:hypothetical protein